MFPKFLATKRYELIEVQIPANSTQTRFNVPDQPQLRTDQDADIICQALETFSILSVNPSPNNIAVVSEAFLLQTYLVLYIQGEESLYRIPLNSLKRTQTPAVALAPFNEFLFTLKNVMVDWTKSYFYTPTPYTPVGNFATFSFLLGLHYMKLPAGTMDNINKAEELNFCYVKPPM